MATKAKKPASTEVSSASFLKQVKPTKRKEPKTEDRWVMPVTPDTTAKAANYCRLAFIQSELDPVVKQHKASCIKALFDTWTERFWATKSVPENPAIVVRYAEDSKHPGMVDMTCLFIVAFLTEGIKSFLPKPEVLVELGQTPQQYVLAALTAESIGLSEKNALRFVNEEMVIEDRVMECMSITEMEHSDNVLLVGYAKKRLAAMMGQVAAPFTQEEIQEAIMIQQVLILKEGMLNRIIGYCRNVDELRKLIDFCKCQKKFGPKIEFGLADASAERIKRMQDTIEEFLLDGESEKDAE